MNQQEMLYDNIAGTKTLSIWNVYDTFFHEEYAKFYRLANW